MAICTRNNCTLEARPGFKQCEKHAAGARASAKKAYHANIETEREKARQRYWEKNGNSAERRAFLAQYQRERGRKSRLEAIAAYGGACVCCGETCSLFLEFHHPKGDGKKHRADVLKEVKGHRFYDKLKNLGWPSDVELLCANCHVAITYIGFCPHQTGEAEKPAQ